MARYKYKFSNKKPSVGGVFSTLMAVCSVVLFVYAIICSFKAEGQGSLIIGSYAFLSLAFALFGGIMGLLSYRESDRHYTFSFIGTLTNFIMLVILVMLFFVGL